MEFAWEMVAPERMQRSQPIQLLPEILMRGPPLKALNDLVQGGQPTRHQVAVCQEHPVALAHP
eukprot:scaffold95835_cov20-Tisochrysis_lutea.AAC.2